MKTALVHDWLVSSIGGGENVLQTMHELFPSPIFTLLYNAQTLQNSYFQNLEIHPSFIQRLPFATKQYRNYLPLFPLAIEQFSFKEFDLILSSSHCVAKGIVSHKEQLHICYCHTPIRYAWDLKDLYLQSLRGLKKWCAGKILENIRKWDAQTAKRVDFFIANSKYVASRIQTSYNASSEVIYPPVDTDFFSFQKKKEDYYVTASRLVQNKKIDLIVEAFRQMPNKKLFIIGEGPEKELLEKKASPNISFLGELSKENLRSYLQNAKAFVFAAIEDFGIAPVEAMATGTPVIAFGQGGALETVIDGQTGLFYKEQTAQSLSQAVQFFETQSFDSEKCLAQALHFSSSKFRRQFQHFVLHKYGEFQKRSR